MLKIDGGDEVVMSERARVSGRTQGGVPTRVHQQVSNLF
jgi:hypothetical protein